MRLTEYFHFMYRKDLKLNRSPKNTDYTHFAPFSYHRRARYLYQCKILGREPVK